MGSVRRLDSTPRIYLSVTASLYPICCVVSATVTRTHQIDNPLISQLFSSIIMYLVFLCRCKGIFHLINRLPLHNTNNSFKMMYNNDAPSRQWLFSPELLLVPSIDSHRMLPRFIAVIQMIRYECLEWMIGRNESVDSIVGLIFIFIFFGSLPPHKLTN